MRGMIWLFCCEAEFGVYGKGGLRSRMNHERKDLLFHPRDAECKELFMFENLFNLIFVNID